MKADAYELSIVFGYERQLFAPLFQRPYVWDKEKQWEPLWNDIKSIAESLAQGNEDVKPHFLSITALISIIKNCRLPISSEWAWQACPY